MRLYGESMMTRMLHDARDTFPPAVARRAEKASVMPLGDLSVLHGEIWVIIRWLVIENVI